MDETSNLMVSACPTKSLNHEQQRRIEVKCIELEAMLEEQGLTQAEISDKVHQLRTILTEGARQMSQTDDKKLTFITDAVVDHQKKSEIEKDACSIASETIGSSQSSGKTSPLPLLPSGTPPDGATPIKYKKRKRKSRDSSISSERKKKYVKKSKKKSPSDGKEKSHKKSKKEKEKYLRKKSNYSKDLKQKKSPDSDGKKKRSKKRSRKHGSLSARDKSNGRDASPSSHKAEEKSEGKKKKRSRSKERRRQSRKRKRNKYRSKERSHHNKRSSSSSQSNDGDASEKKISSSVEPPLMLAPQPDIVEEIKGVETEIIPNIEVPVQILQPVEKFSNDQAEYIVKKSPFHFGIIKNQDNFRKERLLEIAPFRIEPRNNLLLREKITRPFSSPFKKSLDPAKPIDLAPKVAENETVEENFSATVEDATPEGQTEEQKPEDWDVVDAAVLPTEIKAPETKRCWSSSPSSSSRSSRGGSVCSTCSSEGSRRYDSGRDRQRKYSRSPSSRSSSSCRNSRSRSPSIPRRRGSPSFLDRRRITRSEPFCYFVALVDIVLVLESDRFHTTGHLQCRLRLKADAIATMATHRPMTKAAAATLDAVGRAAAAGATVASTAADCLG